jgi:hypothetical protein
MFTMSPDFLVLLAEVADIPDIPDIPDMELLDEDDFAVATEAWLVGALAEDAAATG